MPHHPLNPPTPAGFIFWLIFFPLASLEERGRRCRFSAAQTALRGNAAAGGGRILERAACGCSLVTTAYANRIRRGVWKTARVLQS